MIVGVLKAQLHMQGAPILRKNGKMETHSVTSLKEKRSIVKSLIGRLKSRFNISICEVDHHDNRQSAVIAVVVASKDAAFVDSQLDSIIDFMRKDGRFYLGQTSRESFSC